MGCGKYYGTYLLGVLSFGYTVSELGHYLIGITSKATAKDISYGDFACQLNLTAGYSVHDVPLACHAAVSRQECGGLVLNGTPYCEWDYNGLGLEYQILAGPSFMVPLTVVGVGLGILADRYNRSLLLTGTIMLSALAFALMGACTEFWHMLVLRMLFAAGQAGWNPLGTGILSDIFPEDKLGFVMAIFNWGIYGGYGFAFPIGHYVTISNVWGLGWRLCYYLGGGLSLFAAALTAFFKEPKRQIIGEEKAMRDAGQVGKHGDDQVWWRVLFQPRMIVFCLAASFRNAGGACWSYNCDLFYQQYYPGYDLAWYLFCIYSITGSFGVVVGGLISDKYVKTHGIKSRVAVLAISQLCATPFAFGSVYFSPVWALLTLGFSFFFAEMWFGSLFAVMVEIVPMSVRSTTVAAFLFVMNNMAGALPMIVEPVSKAIGYRESLFLFYVGFYFISSVLFFVAMFMIEKADIPRKDHQSEAYDNPTLTPDSPTDAITVSLVEGGANKPMQEDLSTKL